MPVGAGPRVLRDDLHITRLVRDRPGGELRGHRLLGFAAHVVGHAHRAPLAAIDAEGENNLGREPDPGALVLQHAQPGAFHTLHRAQVDRGKNILALEALPIAGAEIRTTTQAVNERLVTASGVLVRISALQSDRAAAVDLGETGAGVGCQYTKWIVRHLCISMDPAAIP